MVKVPFDLVCVICKRTSKRGKRRREGKESRAGITLVSGTPNNSLIAK